MSRAVMFGIMGIMVSLMVGCGSDERAKIREEERSKLKQEQTRSIEEDEKIRQKIRMDDKRRQDCIKNCENKYRSLFGSNVKSSSMYTHCVEDCR